MEVLEDADAALSNIARSVVQDTLGDGPFKVGDTVRHPSGRMVRITAGQWMSDGRLSNHWSWQEVLPDGSLAQKVEHGYGWNPSSV